MLVLALICMDGKFDIFFKVNKNKSAADFKTDKTWAFKTAFSIPWIPTHTPIFAEKFRQQNLTLGCKIDQGVKNFDFFLPTHPTK